MHKYCISRNFRDIKCLQKASHELFTILFSRMTLRPAKETLHARSYYISQTKVLKFNLVSFLPMVSTLYITWTSVNTMAPIQQRKSRAKSIIMHACIQLTLWSFAITPSLKLIGQHYISCSSEWKVTTPSCLWERSHWDCWISGQQGSRCEQMWWGKLHLVQLSIINGQTKAYQEITYIKYSK